MLLLDRVKGWSYIILWKEEIRTSPFAEYYDLVWEEENYVEGPNVGECYYWTGLKDGVILFYGNKN
jgi:hypothetical protein